MADSREGTRPRTTYHLDPRSAWRQDSVPGSRDRETSDESEAIPAEDAGGSTRRYRGLKDVLVVGQTNGVRLSCISFYSRRELGQMSPEASLPGACRQVVSRPNLSSSG